MRNLFRPPSAAITRDAGAALRAIAAAMPLSEAHKRDLPHAVRDLSRLLTSERDLGEQPYWSSPRLLSAYCRYFLPWNVQRLAWLLPPLRLDELLTAGDRIVDLGSGPLTFPLALWTIFPKLRTLPLAFTCVDVAPHPMDKGREIFTHLAGADNPWRITLLRSPLEAALRKDAGGAKLIMAGNVLNELPPPRRMSVAERMAELAQLLTRRLAADGRFVCVEPGTRLGGKLVASLRHAALLAGELAPESPCPHTGPCPMLVRGGTRWCHFSVPAAGPGAAVPPELLGLTRRAKLEKRSLSVSCLVLRHSDAGDGMPGQNPLDPCADNPGTVPDDDLWTDDAFDLDGDANDTPVETAVIPRPESGHSFIRILSDPILIPGREAHARYACSERGLTLAHNAGRMPSGAALTVRWPEEDSRDPKTGALEVFLPETPARKPSTPEQISLKKQ